MTDNNQEIREHGKDIAKLKSDVFNLDELMRQYMQVQLVKVQTGIEEIKGLIGDGNVMFAQLVAKDTAQQKDIDELKAAKLNRLLFLVYPIIVGVVVVAIVAWFHFPTK